MSIKDKTRLNLYISNELAEKLDKRANTYGVSKSQLAVVLIGQGLAGLEVAMKSIENVVPNELLEK